MTTLGDRLQDRGANNLDFLRLVAALLVILSHCFGLLGYDRDPLDRLTDGWEAFASLGLRIFFFMSGMLVTASWCRTPAMLPFARKRILRIFPGLMVATIFCVFVVGPLGTAMGLGRYLSAPYTYWYLLNGVWPGFSYYLPGVFAFNPNHAVNGSLWTLPYELRCYLVVLVCGKLRLLTPKFFPLAAAVSFALILQHHWLPGEGSPAGGVFRLGGGLEMCEVEFLLGAAAYLYRRWLPMHRGLAVLALAAYLGAWTLPWLGQWVALCAVSYLVLYVAQVRIPALGQWAKYGDLSYGMYIYAFPVQQLFIHTFDVDIGVAGLLPLSVALTAGIAYFSWHLVERPALALRWNPWPRRPDAGMIPSGGVVRPTVPAA